jgi:CRP-like cAMP-binding protein
MTAYAIMDPAYRSRIRYQKATYDVACRLPHTFRALAASAFMTVHSRVARDLVERAQVNRPLRRGLHLNVDQQDLADATGSVREVVAAALQRLQDEGVIAKTNGGIGYPQSGGPDSPGETMKGAASER